MIIGSNQPGAHAPGIDGGFLLFEAGDQMLVQIVAGKNNGVVETCLIEKFASFDAEIGEISRVKPNASKTETLRGQATADMDGMPDAFERIERVHKEDGIVG